MNGIHPDAPSVVHSLPGRIRVHLPAWSGGGQRRLEQDVREHPGVLRVQANSLTRNVLVHFDPKKTNESELLEILDSAQREAADLPEDQPAPDVIEEAPNGRLRRARIAVRGLNLDPAITGRIVQRLKNRLGVSAWSSPLTGRILVEYDAHRTHLEEVLSCFVSVELPNLPSEDRPAHPLDPAPLVQSSTRSIGAGLGLAMLALRRLTGFTPKSSTVRTAATISGVISLLRSFPFIRNGLRRLLGADAADLAFGAAGVISMTFASSPLGLAVTGTEGLILLTEVLYRRNAWRRYEERLGGAAVAEPDAVIRLEGGEKTTLAGQVIEGTGTAIGADGLPMQVTPGARIPSGARLFGGPFVVQLQGGRPFVPQPRPAPPKPHLYQNYLRALNPLSLGYAALIGVMTRSMARTFEALLLVNPRTAIIGAEAANLHAATRLLRCGVTVIGTRPDRAIRRPDFLLLDGPRLLTDGLEVASVLPCRRTALVPADADQDSAATDLLALAGGISTAAGSPWGNAFPRAGQTVADDGTFNGMWAAATVGGVRYTLGPPEDVPDVPEAFLSQHEGGYFLALSREEDDTTLGYLALRPRLAAGALALVQTCKRLGTEVELLCSGSPRAARAVARRAGLPLVETNDSVAAIHERQKAGAHVAVVADSARAAPAYAACDLAVGLSAGPATRFPARADLVAPDLAGVAAIIESGWRRDQAVRDSVAFSALANVFGAGWGLRGGPGIERASHGVYITALLALADGWARLASGRPQGSARSYLVDPKPERWGRLAIAKVLRDLRSSAAGLTNEQAARRPRTAVPSSNGQVLWRAVLDQARSPVNGILAGGGLLSFVAGGALLDIVIIGATIGVNVVVGVWQERQAGAAVDALRKLGTATARVLRNGEPVTLPATEVVPGDVLLLSPGDRVAADARVLEVQGLEVDEATLTGESVPVVKREEGGSAEARIVLEGSDVVVGTGRAVVVAVGARTRLGATAAALSTDEVQESPFGVRLARLLQMSLPLAAAGGATVIASGLLWGRPLLANIGVGVSIAVAVVPESLPLLAGTGQVGVARRLSKRNALLRRLSSVEALGRVDVACTDKTGTLTEGKLAVRLVANLESEAALSDLTDDLRRVLVTAALASPHPEAENVAAHPTDLAIIRAAERAGLGGDLRQERLKEEPFDPAQGFHASAVDGLLCLKGAPEAILPRCTHYRRAGTNQLLSAADRQALMGVVHRLGDRGLRVLLVAEGSSEIEPRDPRDLTALGFVAIGDPLRPAVPEAVRRCREAGVRVVMITGDHPSTAKAIAREAGILEAAGNGDIVSGEELSELPDNELDKRLEKAVVIARATPVDKVRIVEGLRRRGHTVAMTGDGVNDAPALRLADVGVAMGRGGTEVARQAADVVLADDDFSTLVEALVEGRGFWRNMRRALGLLLGGNLGELGLIVGGSVLGLNPPLNTRQILVVNLITDALPALSVVLQQPEHRHLAGLAREGSAALDAPLRRDVARRGAATALPSLTAFLLARRLGRVEEGGSVAFGTVIATQLAQTLDSGWSEGGLNGSVLGAVAGSAGVLASTLSFGPLRALLGLGVTTPFGWSLIGAGAMAGVVIGRAVSLSVTVLDKKSGGEQQDKKGS